MRSPLCHLLSLSDDPVIRHLFPLFPLPLPLCLCPCRHLKSVWTPRYPGTVWTSHNPTMSDLLQRLPIELRSYIFGYLHLGDLVCFSATCKSISKDIRRYILFRWCHLAGCFFHDPDKLFRLLYACQAVISGSGALYLLQPFLATPWIPNDLDIYISHDNAQLLLAALTIEGYCQVLSSPARSKSYLRPQFHSTITFVHSQQTIDVIVATKSTGIYPIFHFHSTILMNFVTHDSICCTYPQLTLRGLSVIHPFFAYDTILNRAAIDALLKYHHHGFVYLTCYHVHVHFHCFKHTSCKLNDKSCMWVVTKLTPFAPHTRCDIYSRLGIINAIWHLGGKLCTTDSYSNFTPSSVRILLDSG